MTLSLRCMTPSSWALGLVCTLGCQGPSAEPSHVHGSAETDPATPTATLAPDSGQSGDTEALPTSCTERVSLGLATSCLLDFTEADAHIYGSVEADAMGTTIGFAGDVNGDGFDDVVVGTRHTTASPSDGYLLHGPISGAIDASTAAVATFYEEGTIGWAASFSAAGDLNADGFGDLWVHGGSSGIHLFHGPLSGAITSASAVATVELGPYVWSLGDVTGNGHPDIAVSDELVRWYLFEGPHSGTLTAEDARLTVLNYECENWPTQMADLGDVDGDGVRDFYIGTDSTGACDTAVEKYGVVISGALTGTLDVTSAGDHIPIAYINETTGPVTSSDVNGDGYVDLLMGRPSGLHIFLGPIDHSLEAGTDADLVVVSDPPRFADPIRIGDIDSDGVDEVLAIFGGGSHTWKGWLVDIGVPTPSSLVVETGIWSIESTAGQLQATAAGGDVDGDGLPDVLLSVPFGDWGGVSAAGVSALVLGNRF